VQPQYHYGDLDRALHRYSSGTELLKNMHKKLSTLGDHTIFGEKRHCARRCGQMTIMRPAAPRAPRTYRKWQKSKF